MSNITDGSLNDILCPWDTQHKNKKEFTREGDMEDLKTEDYGDIPDINNDKEIIKSIKEEEINSTLDSSFGQECDNYETDASITMVKCAVQQ